MATTRLTKTTTTTTVLTTVEDAAGEIRISNANGDFRRIRPLTNRAILVRRINNTDMIYVTVRRLNLLEVASICCKVGNLTDTPFTLPDPIDPANLPAGVFQLPLVADNIFQASVPVLNIAPAIAISPLPNTVIPNQKIVIAGYNANLSRCDPITFPFIAILQNSTVSVSAKGCLFFAYAQELNATSAPPRTGESLSTNRPTFVPVPIDEDFLRVNISVPNEAGATQKWNNSGAILVDAAGEAGDFDITNADYISDNYYSNNIKKLSAAGPELLDGSLVSMWDMGFDNSSDSQLCVETSIGLQKMVDKPQVSSSLGEDRFNLLLGQHAEADWSKSSLALNVSLEWKVQ
jgi:hypothetical protein